MKRIKQVVFFMDGGSQLLTCSDEFGNTFEVLFVQNVVWEILEGRELPGRVYIDNKLIAQRSEEEEKLIEFIEKANKDFLKKAIINEINVYISYMKSKEYLSNVNKVKIIKNRDFNRPSNSSNSDKGLC